MRRRSISFRLSRSSQLAAQAVRGRDFSYPQCFAFRTARARPVANNAAAPPRGKRARAVLRAGANAESQARGVLPVGVNAEHRCFAQGYHMRVLNKKAHRPHSFTSVGKATEGAVAGLPSANLSSERTVHRQRCACRFTAAQLKR